MGIGFNGNYWYFTVLCICFYVVFLKEQTMWVSTDTTQSAIELMTNPRYHTTTKTPSNPEGTKTAKETRLSQNLNLKAMTLTFSLHIVLWRLHVNGVQCMYTSSHNKQKKICWYWIYTVKLTCAGVSPPFWICSWFRHHRTQTVGLDVRSSHRLWQSSHSSNAILSWPYPIHLFCNDLQWKCRFIFGTTSTSFHFPYLWMERTSTSCQ